MNYVKRAWELTLIFSLVCTGVLAENESISAPAILNAPENTEVSTDDSYSSGILDLVTGWNFVGIPRRLGEGKNKATIFSAVESEGRSIWSYETEKGGWKELTADDILMPLDGYFVYSNKPVQIPLSYSIDPLQVPPVKDLAAGWNMVGFSGATPASARDSLLSIRKTWTQVIGWDPSGQKFDETIINGGNGTHADSAMLIPMRAYWVFASDPCSLASIGA
ncbi:MAG TPA: hypothetical protein VN372_13630 [Methanospirillum sp.]|nr:hypothetical protein [Methanospirillum sp.]